MQVHNMDARARYYNLYDAYVHDIRCGTRTLYRLTFDIYVLNVQNYYFRIYIRTCV